MNDLSTSLREEIAQLNFVPEKAYFELAKRLSYVSEHKLYSEWGYDSLAQYVKQQLTRSKTFASNILKVGTWMLENAKEPDELIGTSYARLAQAIRANPNNPQLALAEATTLSEDELIGKAREAKFGEHEPTWIEVCEICKTPRKLHAT